MSPKALPRNIQELSPKWAKFCLDIEKYGRSACSHNFSKSVSITAVSGGADSTALLLISSILARKSCGSVVCANLDHGLRPESADESSFVRTLCSELDIPFHHEQADTKAYAYQNGLGIEDAGRKLRYAFLARLKEEIGADYILTAHHLGDLSEDIIMRLARGTGWPALGGMPAYDSRRRLLRPLMGCTKQSLMDFLTEYRCNWCEDESNLSDEWTRNRFRNNILPLLRKENPSLDENLSRLHDQAALDADYFQHELRLLEKQTEKTEQQVLVPKRTIENLHPALRFRFFKYIIDELGPGQALYESIHALNAAFVDKRTGKVFQFPGGKSAELKRNAIVFKPGSSDH